MRRYDWRQSIVIAAAVLSLVAGGRPAGAQTGTPVTGRVVDGQGLAIPGATVELWTHARAFVGSTVSDRTGGFRFDGVVPGEYVVIAALLGFESSEDRVAIGRDVVDLVIVLSVGGFAQEVTVTAVMPEVAAELVLPAREIEQHGTRDVVAALRATSGVNAVRRGPINLEPTVRGLYEGQLGLFVDGTRTFAAGPARMDSDISHVSPHMLQAVRVVKGPYALSWGAGALSAVQVETFKPSFSSGEFLLGGRAGFNHNGNGNGNDGFVGLWGRNDRVRFTLLHNTRTGDDYTDGDGTRIPGHYESFETRWSIGSRVIPDLLVEYSGGYQKQNDLDFPGRILDAELFETQSHAVDLHLTRSAGLVTEVFGQVYANLKDHRMNNDGKPTALDAPGRLPPFGLDVDLPTSSDTVGGRFHVGLGQGPLSYKAGLDVYRVEQSARRFISQRSTGRLLFEDIVWPDARMTNVGGYGQVIYDQGRARIGGTLRVDREQATAGEVSVFFAENTTGDLDQTSTHVSAAANATVRMSDTWVVNLGIGRAVRTPTTLERYSDRFPSTKFQVAAEFMGHPALRPERSLEVDVGTMLRVADATLEGDFFYRTIDDYITVLPDPDLPRRLPLSPPVVYRYINGDQARFTGFDLGARTGLGPLVDVRGTWTYVWAKDTFFDEPLFGIAPFEQRYTVRLHTEDNVIWAELLLTNAAAQDRVADARLEQPTDGWTALDLRAGALIVEGVFLKLGIENLTNAFYATHLNALNPFTRERIAEVGRSAYVGLEYGF